MRIKHLIPALVLLALTAHAQADTVEYLHTDILGNVVAVTDENANVIERRVYEPYGLPETPIPDGPGFTGHDMDGETGLVYMQQRYYDPMVGRFLSPDPKAVDFTTAWNFNRYNYAANNPYKFVDADGREAGFAYGRDGSMNHFYNEHAPDADLAMAVLDFTVVGDVIAIKSAFDDPSALKITVAVLGIAPGIGDFAAKGIKAGAKLIGNVKSAPDFVVSSGGTAYPVPGGATGPTPVINKNGTETGSAFTGGSGGANGQVSSMRIMNPNPRNPDGYIKYENSLGQGVDPYSGRTVDPVEAHIKLDR